jgi:hypothetical protein
MIETGNAGRRFTCGKMSPQKSGRGRSVTRAFRAMLSEDRRLLLGSAAFAIAGIVVYALVRRLRIFG